MAYSKEFITDLYKKLLGTRLSEEKLVAIYKEGRVPGHIHSGVGQEATHVGTLVTSKEGDYFKLAHRVVSISSVLGVPFSKIYAEILGRQDGNSRGGGGVNHIADFSKGILGMSGTLGCDMPFAVGAAYKLKLEKKDNIVYCYYGDGTSNRGPVHEAMNWAAAWKLPILFVMDNNQWAISTCIYESTAIENPGADRAAAYGMASKVVDGTDVLAVYEAAKELSEYVRAGNGPAILEAKNYRWRGHFEGDQCKYRDPAITEKWQKKRNCVKKMENYMLENDFITEDEIKTMYEEIDAELNAAVDFAEASPKATAEDLFNNIFA
ncbi:thiamine pyrophosphate-dependent dehydrogenase E1 component subunit alpha [Anaerotignum sp.]|uniref:thiamine pyrophosphate-dependent dehydrogenase E1 component subunit alpha n=1 Tax=Anaerotignum sp. TaxID=2039241 RepID=UPI003333C9FE